MLCRVSRAGAGRKEGVYYAFSVAKCQLVDLRIGACCVVAGMGSGIPYAGFRSKFRDIGASLGRSRTKLAFCGTADTDRTTACCGCG